MIMLTERKEDFFSRIQLVDNELVLLFTGKERVSPPDMDIFEYRFSMNNAETGDEMGQINIKAGYTENIIFFRGNIGYTVYERYRGNYYSSRSCKLLIPVIKFLDLNSVYLTCNKDNIASRKNIERLGAEFLGTEIIQETSPYFSYYPEGSRVKLRYKWEVPRCLKEIPA